MPSPKDNIVTQRLRQNLIYLRNKSGLSMSELAEELGVRKGNIGNWEISPLQCSPALFDLVKIASFYKLKVDDLLNKDLSMSSVLPSEKK